MNLFPLKKVTIVAERLLRDSLFKLIREQGSTGHTIMAVEGEGSRGIHATDFEGRHVQIETIVSSEVAERILKQIESELLENFAVITYVSDVAVLRPDKFSLDQSDSTTPDTTGENE